MFRYCRMEGLGNNSRFCDNLVSSGVRHTDGLLSVLKGHGFSRAANRAESVRALAPEGMSVTRGARPANKIVDAISGGHH